MADLILALIRRVRPFEGWPTFMLGLALVVCLQQLAATAQITIASATVGLAGLLGLLLGRLLGRWAAPRRTQEAADGRIVAAPDVVAPTRWRRGAFWGVAGLVLLLGGSLVLLQSGRALPPPNLVWRDLTTAGRLIAPEPTAAPETPPAPVPAPRPVTTVRWDSIAFLESSLPRFWREVRGAPNGGQGGARLIVEMSSVLLAWGSMFLLGVALRRGGRLAAWGLAVLAALVTAKLLGGGASYWLVIGLAALLLLALLDGFTRHEQHWLARRLDYASDLRFDTAIWGGGTLIVVLLLAALLPFTFDNRLANWIWSWVEPPSGIAALERTIDENERAQQAAPRARIAGSTLPSVELGRSLEEGDSNEEALLVRVSQPLPEGPWPHYWRSRVLTIYTGRSWYTNAQVAPERPLSLPAGVAVDLIVQDIEDRNPERQLIYGLPEVIGVNREAEAERLPDGTLAATTLSSPAGTYRVFSRLPSAGPLVAARPDEQPDLTPYLQLPPDLPPRVLDLARTVTRDATGAEEAALALERYLRELPYSYEVAPLIDRGDGVDQFLFSMRQGYCTYYASAFAVLARSLGIPARVSLGYATGEYDAATRTYRVHERDAHAWPELYIDGRWVAFEPTPVRPLPARNGVQQRPEPVPVAPEPVPVVPLWEQLWGYWPGLLVGLGLLLLLALPWLPRLRSDYSAGAIQRQLELHGGRAGVAWPAGATLGEYAALLRPRVGPAATSLDTLVQLLEEARYSGHGLSPDQQGRLLVAWAMVRQQIR